MDKAGMGLTLENLAWFDRCIFPDDIEKDLVSLGDGCVFSNGNQKIHKRKGQYCWNS